MVFEFQDGPTVNEFEIIVLLGLVWVYAGKIDSFGRVRRENEFDLIPETEKVR